MNALDYLLDLYDRVAGDNSDTDIASFTEQIVGTLQDDNDKNEENAVLPVYCYVVIIVVIHFIGFVNLHVNPIRTLPNDQFDCALFEMDKSLWEIHSINQNKIKIITSIKSIRPSFDGSYAFLVPTEININFENYNRVNNEITWEDIKDLHTISHSAYIVSFNTNVYKTALECVEYEKWNRKGYTFVNTSKINNNSIVYDNKTITNYTQYLNLQSNFITFMNKYEYINLDETDEYYLNINGKKFWQWIQWNQGLTYPLYVLTNFAILANMVWFAPFPFNVIVTVAFANYELRWMYYSLCPMYQIYADKDYIIDAAILSGWIHFAIGDYNPSIYIATIIMDGILNWIIFISIIILAILFCVEWFNFEADVIGICSIVLLLIAFVYSFLLGILYGIFVILDLIRYSYLGINDNSKLFVVTFVMYYIVAFITVIPKLVRKYEQYKESKKENDETETQIELNVGISKEYENKSTDELLKSFYDDVHCGIDEIASTFKKQSQKSKDAIWDALVTESVLVNHIEIYTIVMGLIALTLKTKQINDKPPIYSIKALTKQLLTKLPEIDNKPMLRKEDFNNLHNFLLQIHREVHNITAKRDDSLSLQQTENDNDDSNNDVNEEINNPIDEKPIEPTTEITEHKSEQIIVETAADKLENESINSANNEEVDDDEELVDIIQRAITIVSEEEQKNTDIEHLKKWIENTLECKFENSLFDELKSGVILCELLNVFKPEICTKYKHSSIPRICRRNIEIYISGCRQIQMGKNDLFAPNDLMKEFNIEKVINNLNTLNNMMSETDDDEIDGLNEKQMDNEDDEVIVKRKTEEIEIINREVTTTEIDRFYENFKNKSVKNVNMNNINMQETVSKSRHNRIRDLIESDEKKNERKKRREERRKRRGFKKNED